MKRSAMTQEQSPVDQEPVDAAERVKYRFKSYRDANTVERERIETMRATLPNKIDEVMDSFRRDRISRQVESMRKAEASTEPSAAAEPAAPDVAASQAALNPALLAPSADFFDQLAAPPPAPEPEMVVPERRARPLPTLNVEPPAAEPVAPAKPALVEELESGSTLSLAREAKQALPKGSEEVPLAPVLDEQSVESMEAHFADLESGVVPAPAAVSKPSPAAPVARAPIAAVPVAATPAQMQTVIAPPALDIPEPEVIAPPEDETLSVPVAAAVVPSAEPVNRVFEQAIADEMTLASQRQQAAAAPAPKKKSAWPKILGWSVAAVLGLTVVVLGFFPNLMSPAGNAESDPVATPAANTAAPEANATASGSADKAQAGTETGSVLKEEPAPAAATSTLTAPVQPAAEPRVTEPKPVATHVAEPQAKPVKPHVEKHLAKKIPAEKPLLENPMLEKPAKHEKTAAAKTNKKAGHKKDSGAEHYSEDITGLLKH